MTSGRVTAPYSQEHAGFSSVLGVFLAKITRSYSIHERHVCEGSTSIRSRTESKKEIGSDPLWGGSPRSNVCSCDLGPQAVEVTRETSDTLPRALAQNWAVEGGKSTETRAGAAR